MSKRVAVSALALCLSLPVIAQAEGNPQQGRALASNCVGCHAVPGYNNVYPTYKVPMLAGQSPQYLVDALKAYKNGKRSHQTMQAQAASLSEQDMQDLAAYFSAQTPAGE